MTSRSAPGGLDPPLAMSFLSLVTTHHREVMRSRPAPGRPGSATTGSTRLRGFTCFEASRSSCESVHVRRELPHAARPLLSWASAPPELSPSTARDPRTHPVTTRFREELGARAPSPDRHHALRAPKPRRATRQVPRCEVEWTTQRNSRPSAPGEIEDRNTRNRSISSAVSGLLPDRSAPPLGGEPYSLDLERRNVTTRSCERATALRVRAYEALRYGESGVSSARWLPSRKRSPALLGFLASSPTS